MLVWQAAFQKQILYEWDCNPFVGEKYSILGK